MKISNMNRAVELIDKHKAYKKFYDFQKKALDEALEPAQSDSPDICMHLQLIGPRTNSMTIAIKYGSELYFSLMECIEGELNRIEDELSDL